MIKSTVGFLLKKFPRSFLQIISKPIFSIITLLYKGNNVLCPICKIELKKFFPYGRETRENALCPNCLSLERHRLLFLYLKSETDVFKKNINLLHIAPEECFINIFKKSKNISYTTGDLYSPLAEVKMDIHKIPFQNETFDVILCNHVLEHVDDDKKALKEIERVMKKEGFAILQVPFYYPIPEKTLEDRSIINPAEREKDYGQSDHVRKYGKDYPERIKSQGMKVNENKFTESFNKEEKKYFGLPDNEVIYYCYK
tara:strand:- start:1198 stop:1965 length:768 start_codon:yes stop_codon:yes gene_type:complete